MSHTFDLERYQEIIAAERKYTSLIEAAYGELKAIADDIRDRYAQALAELYPEDSPAHQYKRRNHWSYHADRCEVGCTDGAIIAEFWQRGRGGDVDEIVRTLDLTPELLTPEGRAAYIEVWRRYRMTQDETTAKKAEEARLTKIRGLEAELAKLKGK